MSRKARLRKMAEGLRNKTERKPLHITAEAKITRVAMLFFKRNAASKIEQGSVICTRRTLEGYAAKLRYNLQHLQVVKVERVWEVSVGGKHVEYWENLIMAQAQRDGLNYHFARHLMTEGTAAEGA